MRTARSPVAASMTFGESVGSARTCDTERGSTVLYGWGGRGTAAEREHERHNAATERGDTTLAPAGRTVKSRTAQPLQTPQPTRRRASGRRYAKPEARTAAQRHVCEAVEVATDRAGSRRSRRRWPPCWWRLRPSVRRARGRSWSRASRCTAACSRDLRPVRTSCPACAASSRRGYASGGCPRGCRAPPPGGGGADAQRFAPAARAAWHRLQVTAWLVGIRQW